MSFGGLTLAALLALGGCPKAPLPGTITTEELSAAPRLPSPTSRTYARVPRAPSDPVIAALIGEELRWDASLSGAAAGVALQLSGGDMAAMERWRVREHLWRAGYPYPIYTASRWATAFDAQPPDGLRQWLEQRTDADDIGLVRARGQTQDHWVALAAQPRVTLPTMPRLLGANGATLVLPANPGIDWAAGAPDGRVWHGTLAAETRVGLDAPGEWLIELRDAKGLAASMVIYVDLPAPEDLLLEPSEPTSTAQEAIGETALQLARVRDAWGLPDLVRDPMLDAAARAWLDEPGRDPAGLTTGLGYEPTPVTWRCQGATVQDCLDQVVWEPTARSALINEAHNALGIAARHGNTLKIVGIIGTPSTP